MKKLALILALSLVIPLLTTAQASAAATYSDLAIGDPLSRGHRKKKAKPAEKSDNPLGGVPVEASGPRAKTTTPPDSPAAEKPAEKATAK